MAKKLKLAQALAKHQKQTTSNAKVNKPQKVESNSKNKPTGIVEKMEKVERGEYVPMHLWTDTEGRRAITRIPFHPNFEGTVLLCGEGDFSFTRALVEHFTKKQEDDQDMIVDEDGEGTEGRQKWTIIATALDSEEEAVRKYPQIKEILAFLRDSRFKDNIQVMFNVDATKLDDNKSLIKALKAIPRPLSRVVFNFPHTGAGIKDRDRNIRAQQSMLKGFFDSTAKLLAALKTQGQVSLLKRYSEETFCEYKTTMTLKGRNTSQGSWLLGKKNSGKSDDEDSDKEIFEDNFDEYGNEDSSFDRHHIGQSLQILVSLKTGEPYDAWNVKQLGAATNVFICQESFEFLPDLYPGYQHCRTIGGSEGDAVDVDTDSAGISSWKEFLAGKPAKTFVFSCKNARRTLKVEKKRPAKDSNNSKEGKKKMQKK